MSKKSGNTGRPAAGRKTVRNPPATPPGPVTRIEAKVDVGFGNLLYLRGEGGGLSWEKGQPLECVDEATWVWICAGTREDVVFKLLLNDETWCKGENIRVGAGRCVEVVPAF